jgi:hypothetical protein
VCLGNTSEAQAAEDDLPVTIEVVDQEGLPISIAAIRSPDEGILHRVNHVTGIWRAEALYLQDGTRVPFTNRQTIDFEVSAPGYESSQLQLRVRKRKNKVTVTLVPMDVLADSEPTDEPEISFGRSMPID